MNENITIRMATESDTEEILAIYAPYVTDTAITFEYVVPTTKEFAERVRNILKKYPYLVALRDNAIVGYAYASAFNKRAAYGWAVETSVYVKQEGRKNGIGKKLYQVLEEILKKQNIINMNACIAYPNPESIGFHKHMGYKTVGHFTKCGYKFDTWYDIIWMEKVIGKHTINPKPVIPIIQLNIFEEYSLTK
ncbi:phosphinothricin acetyltransferase [Desulfotomaculum arcticum]|uniref:Phosphinothricin acetyltransferase n=1 Tax=Desulfotruncus arcticus DSM 17038 TaxID=1121424 RepID=A0A1I2Y158_9FIRM|nr:GNAT family N-acetyltransferase [Desulfotruncus arcticus]SFH18696.1 phosphinothricin acetyltransferase [Desulfotomaculum arcticum] [Desulfotruncus arcticus DSM 17038]